MQDGTPVQDKPAPTEATLHEAALRYLARYAATQAGLIRVLDRRIERWARAAADPEAAADAARGARDAARVVVARLAAAGAVDDATFAASRARSLTRAGRSRRAVTAHLAARGVAGETLRAALPEEADAELAAAVALARRRRIGPFRAADADADARRRELAALARAGFAPETALRALGLDGDTAEELLARLRRL